jgi:hypothetical protein
MPRPAALTLGQAILGLEALAALFATSLVSGLARTGAGWPTQGWIWGVGLATAALLLVAAGTLGRPRGRVLGWGVQAPMILAGAVSLPVAMVGTVFLGLWIAALRIGDRIDRERAAYRDAPRPAQRDAPARDARTQPGDGAA